MYLMGIGNLIKTFFRDLFDRENFMPKSAEEKLEESNANATKIINTALFSEEMAVKTLKERYPEKFIGKKCISIEMREGDNIILIGKFNIKEKEIHNVPIQVDDKIFNYKITLIKEVSQAR